MVFFYFEKSKESFMVICLRFIRSSMVMPKKVVDVLFSWEVSLRDKIVTFIWILSLSFSFAERGITLSIFQWLNENHYWGVLYDWTVIFGSIPTSFSFEIYIVVFSSYFCKYHVYLSCSLL